MPLGRSSGMESTVRPRKPIISPENTFPSSVRMAQPSPTEQNGPSDSTSWPTALVTRPVHRKVENSSNRRKYGFRYSRLAINAHWDAGPADQKSPARSPSDGFPG